MNIILIGMPTSGKSTVGVILAKILGMNFLDTDLLIQQRTGKKLSEIIASEGTDGFLRIEEEVCSSVDAENTVIATGGSAVYGQNAMRHLKENGKAVYLQISPEELKKRLRDAKARGVVLREGTGLDEFYAERAALYTRYADVIVPEEGLTLEETVGAVRESLRE